MSSVSDVHHIFFVCGGAANIKNISVIETLIPLYDEIPLTPSFFIILSFLKPALYLDCLVLTSELN